MFFSEDLLRLKEDDFPNLRNTDYGDYIIQAVLVTKENDTIYSNPVTIHYLEK
jgi:hypothetical protein